MMTDQSGGRLKGYLADDADNALAKIVKRHGSKLEATVNRVEKPP
jgi:hypothetical protein